MEKNVSVQRLQGDEVKLLYNFSLLQCLYDMESFFQDYYTAINRDQIDEEEVQMESENVDIEWSRMLRLGRLIDNMLRKLIIKEGDSHESFILNSLTEELGLLKAIEAEL